MGHAQATVSRQDIVAGLAVAGLLIPEAVAYATIAGLPPIHAIIASIVGPLAYLLIGRSRVAVVSPTSSSAAVLAAATLAIGLPRPELRAAAAFLLVGMAGAIFCMAGLLRVGALASFVSRPVLRGFAFGLAITIVIRQIGAMTGTASTAANTLVRLWEILASVGQWNVSGAVTGGLALAALIVLCRWPRVPGAVVVLLAAIAMSWVVDFAAHGVAQVGAIDVRITAPVVPVLSLRQWLALASHALPLALIVFVETWGTVRTFALRHGDAIEPDRELIAVGGANLLAGLLGGLPVGAGFSASSANEAAGAQTRFAAPLAAVAVGGLALIAAPLIARVPEPVLAAIVVAALAHALDIRPFLRLWRIDRDQWIALLAAVAVLMLGVLNGMLAAIVLSVLALVGRIARPQLAILGQLAGGRDYADVARHPEATLHPGILVARPGEPLFFANAEPMLAAVERLARDQHATVIVLSMEDSNDLDSTALDALCESALRLRAAGMALVLARLKDPVHDLLDSAGGIAADLAGKGTRSVAGAVEAALTVPKS